MTDQPTIYLDHNATTPVDRRVLEAMLPFFTQTFGNAASRQHATGRAAAEAVESARRQVASLIGADEREIVFTSGATESNNLAIKGAAKWLRDEGRRGSHIVTTSIEHSSVREVCQRLERQGFTVTYVDPLPSGVISPDAVAAAIRPETCLVSVMWANNEIGTVNDLAAIGRICKEREVILHTDATQIVGKLSVDVNAAGVDLLSLSGHKVYGPKGVGALFMRRKQPRVRVEPQMDGGGHERGVRSGTVNVPGVVGLGAACELAGKLMAEEAGRVAQLRDAFEAELMRRIPGVGVQGAGALRLPGTSSVRFPGGDAERMIAALAGVACSSGAACTTASMEASIVLRRIGLSEAEARSVIRFSLGRGTTAEQIGSAVEQIVQAYRNPPRPRKSDTCGV
jgi:cysteine desulfurase